MHSKFGNAFANFCQALSKLNIDILKQAVAESPRGMRRAALAIRVF